MTSNLPELNDVYTELQNVLARLQALDAAKIESANLVPMVKAVQSIGAYTAALDAQIQERAIGNGELIAGVVVKDATTHRRWNDTEAAVQLARETFGDAAFDVSLKSPAQIEKLPKGDVFVAMAAFKPPAGKKVVY